MNSKELYKAIIKAQNRALDKVEEMSNTHFEFDTVALNDIVEILSDSAKEGRRLYPLCPHCSHPEIPEMVGEGCEECDFMGVMIPRS